MDAIDGGQALGRLRRSHPVEAVCAMHPNVATLYDVLASDDARAFSIDAVLMLAAFALTVTFSCALTMCVLRLRMRFLRYMCSVRGSPIPLSPTIADTEADLPPTPGGAAAPSMQHPPPFEDVEDGEHDGSSKGDGVQREPSAGEPSTGSRRRTHKVHCFLILGRDYFHKQCRLSPRVVTHAAHVNATLQELFAQELFAQELLTPDRGSRLRVDGMEVQYMSVAGVPTLLTSDTPISAVLSSGAILVSDRPVAELVTQVVF